MPDKTKKMLENLAQTLSAMPEEAAENALSHAAARAEGILAGLALAEELAHAEKPA